MEVLPETRKKIRILVTQPYKQSRLTVQFTPHTAPDGLVSFPSYPDDQHQHLRRLHDKAVQAVPVVTDATCQSSMQVPFSRWVATGPLEAAEDADAAPITLSSEVVQRLMQGVEETSAVDVLGDDWGALQTKSQVSEGRPWGRVAQAAPARQVVSIKGPKTRVQDAGRKPEDAGAGLASTKAAALGDDAAGSDERPDDRADVLKLQVFQKKMIKKFYEKRAAELASESRVDRFFRHLEIQRQKLNVKNDLKEEKQEK